MNIQLTMKNFFKLKIILIIYNFWYIKAYINSNFIINFFEVNETGFRYLTISSFSNGDMILAITAFKRSTQRIFFGLKENGYSLFGNGNSYYYSIDTKSNGNEEKYESESIVIKLSGNNNNGEEFFLNTGNKNSYAELYDFKSNDNNIYEKTMTSFAKYYVGSFRNSAISLFSNDNNYFYLFGFVIEYLNNYLYILEKHRFESNTNFPSDDTCKKITIIDVSHLSRDGISCFQTKNEIIICLILNNYKKYCVYSFDKDLNQTYNTFLYQDNNLNDNAPFYKCIHFKEEIGIFSFYYNSGFPTIIFKKCEVSAMNNYTIKDITLTKRNFNSLLLANDIIKLSKNKICFSSIDTSKTSIYIVLISIFNDDTNYKIRYYSLNVKDLKNYYLYGDIRLHNYNNYIAYAFRFCKSSSCGEDIDIYYSALVLFSYSNSTDNSTDLFQFLIDNYNSTINDFSVNLESDIRIENNIFGYVFNGIIIKNLINCNNPALLSSSLNNILNINSTMEKNELIKLKFYDNNYSAFNCNLQYRHIISEPDLIEYDKYPDLIEGTNESVDDFIKEKYYGKLTNYYIISSQNLSTDCVDVNCHLCLKNTKSVCIICKYDFIYNTNLKKKECSESIISVETTNVIKSSEEYLESIISFETTNVNKSSDNNYSWVPLDINYKSDIIYNTTIISNYQQKYNYIDYFNNLLIKSYNNSSDNLSKVENELVNGYLDIFILNIIEKEKKDIIINDNNKIYQLTSSYNQYYNKYDNLSNINIENCETRLRLYYNISNNTALLILKVEIHEEGLLIPRLEYQIYNIKTKEKLDLNICKFIHIDLYIPVNIDENNLIKYNSSNEFYNDFCYPYTTENKTDILLKDRRNEFINNNLSLCEPNCRYMGYNKDIKKVLCECFIKIKFPLITEININKNKLLKNFQDLKYTLNINVMKCYNKLFTINGITKNILFYIMSIIILLTIILTILFKMKGYNKIKFQINQIKKIKVNKSVVKETIKKYENKLNNKNEDKNKLRDKEVKTNIVNITNNKNRKNKRKKKIKKNRMMTNGEISSKSYKKIELNNPNIIKSNIIIPKDNKNQPNILNNNIIINKYNECEVNNMNYNDALKNDKRTYFQYYFSLIKTKHIIIFTFYTKNDYNSKKIKIILFLFFLV